ncbi:MarR family winged helix-turn-helix transcriptional regulator [Faecalimonas sp.]
MRKISDILIMIRGLDKLNNKCLEPVRKKYALSQIEVIIMGFLHNNPGKDTVGDISSWRMLPKGNVSQGVESLIQKGFLQRFPDKADRRKIHLCITEKANEMIVGIDKARNLYDKQIFNGLSEEEKKMYFRINEKILENVFESLER